MCMIIIPWVKYWYRPLSIGVRNSPDIFQEKMNKMFPGFEFFQAYIDDILIIAKGDWSNHLENWKLTLQNLKENRLNCNIENLYFGQTEMEYLSF